MVKTTDGAKVLEEGDIYFLYRPKVEEEHPEGLGDVQRFYMVLKPRGKPHFRLTIIGRKRMPDIEGHERNWGFVDKVASSAEAIEKELAEEPSIAERRTPAARPAGEGVYAIVKKRRNMHLAYALELPESPGPVQEELGIAPEGSMVVSVKNPEKPTRRKGVGLSEERQADYPEEKQREFHGRRFQQEDPELLDFEGTEFILIGASEDVTGELGVEIETEDERPDCADIVRQLKIERSRHPHEPLLSGQWR